MNGTIAISKLASVASSGSAMLRRVWQPLWSVLTFSMADESIYPGNILSASLEKGSLSVAYGTRFLSRLGIRGVREYKFEEDAYPQPEFLASSLALAAGDLGAAKSGISLSIPKSWAIITTAEFPATVRDNLSDVISYELDRITPFSSEEAFYDYKVLSEGEGKISVLVVAAKANFIRPYIDALRENGLTVNRITVNLSALGMLCRYIGGRPDRVFVEIGQEGYEGALFLNGSVGGTFSGSFSGKNGGRERIDSVMSEIAPLIDMIKARGKAPLITALLKDKSADLREMLNTQTGGQVEILNETDIKIRISGNYKEIPYAAVGGVVEALWSRARALDLFKKGRHEGVKPPKGLTIALLLAILAMWIVYIVSPVRIEQNRLDEIDRQIALRKDEVKRVETLQKDVTALDKEIATITDFKENRPMALNILKELTTILPKNTWLTRARITQTTVEIEGYAPSSSGLLPKLEASRYFKKVEFSSPTFRDTRMNADRFNIKMEIKGYKEAEKKKEGTDESEE